MGIEQLLIDIVQYRLHYRRYCRYQLSLQEAYRCESDHMYRRIKKPETLAEVYGGRGMYRGLPRRVAAPPRRRISAIPLWAGLPNQIDIEHTDSTIQKRSNEIARGRKS